MRCTLLLALLLIRGAAQEKLPCSIDLLGEKYREQYRVLKSNLTQLLQDSELTDCRFSSLDQLLNYTTNSWNELSETKDPADLGTAFYRDMIQMENIPAHLCTHASAFSESFKIALCMIDCKLGALTATDDLDNFLPGFVYFINALHLSSMEADTLKQVLVLLMANYRVYKMTIHGSSVVVNINQGMNLLWRITTAYVKHTMNLSRSGILSATLAGILYCRGI